MDLTKKLMKTRLIIIGMVIGVSAGAFAQEYDDMYFRSKDREMLTTSVSSPSAGKDSYSSFKKKHFEDVTMLDEYINPSDSYSARNINPEYIARSSSAQATADEGNYFVEGYSPQMLNSMNRNNTSNFNTMNNSWYNTGWFGPSFYGARSPYSFYGMNDPWMMNRFGYGMGMGMYDPWMMNRYGAGFGWNDPWMMNPYRTGFGFNQGWSLSMNSFWGNSFGGSWFNPYFGNSWGMSPWNNFYHPGYYRPNTVVVVTDGSNYSKRPSRSSAYSNTATNNTPTRTRTVGDLTRDNTNSTVNTGGRQRTTADEYYVRPTRRTYTDINSSNTNTSSRGYNSEAIRGSSNTTRSSSYSSPMRSSESSGFSSPSRSSSGSSGFSAPSRSSGSSSGSSSSGGSRRGGN
jgi:hypothetical protein